jgi:hypothetical protein
MVAGIEAGNDGIEDAGDEFADLRYIIQLGYDFGCGG